jgi:hypothetical protein
MCRNKESLDATFLKPISYQMTINFYVLSSLMKKHDLMLCVELLGYHRIKNSSWMHNL